MKTAWRMLGLDWTRLISDYFGFSGYHFPLYSFKLCVDHHTLVTFCIHGDRKLVGRGLLYVLSRKFLLLDAFGALYNTLSLIA